MASTGERLFVGTRRGTVLVVDPADLAAAPVVRQAHREDASAAATSADGRWLATGGDDRTVVVWAVGADGALAERWRLVGQSDRVTGLSFSADGSRLAAGGEDRAVVLWDLQRGERIGEPIGLPVVSGVAFDGTGEQERLLVAGQGLARWPMAPSAWRRRACEVLGGAVLGEVERTQFLRGAAPARTCAAPTAGP